MCFYYVSQWKICQVEPDTEPKLSYPILLQKPVLLQKEDEVLSSILQKKKMFLEVIIFFLLLFIVNLFLYLRFWITGSFNVAIWTISAPSV